MTRRSIGLLGIFLLVGVFAFAFLFDRWWQSLGTPTGPTATANPPTPTEQCPTLEVKTPRELTVVANEIGATEGFAMDASGFYWSSGPVEPFSIRRGEPGKASITLAPKLGARPERVAVDAKNVYWSHWNGVLAAPKGGGTVTELAAAGGPLVSDSAGVYWSSKLGVFWLPTGSKQITKMIATDLSAKAIGSTSAEVIVGGFGITAISKTSNSVRKLTDIDVRFLVVDGDEIYTSDSHAVRRTNLKSGVTVPIGPARPCDNTVMGLAVDAKNIYLGCWLIVRGPLRSDAGSIVSLPKAGGCPVALVTNADRPDDIVTFDGAVYWHDYQQIRRLVP